MLVLGGDGGDGEGVGFVAEGELVGEGGGVGVAGGEGEIDVLAGTPGEGGGEGGEWDANLD